MYPTFGKQPFDLAFGYLQYAGCLSFRDQFHRVMASVADLMKNGTRKGSGKAGDPCDLKPEFSCHESVAVFLL